MSDELRRRELAKIHCLKRDLGLPDDAYRALLLELAGVSSAADLDLRGRRLVLDRLARDARQHTRGHAGRPHNLASANAPAELRKVGALLADSKRPWSYADGIAKRMYEVERLAWCTAEQLRGVIAALTVDARRRGKRAR